jgi:acetylornithine deacetylase/succinyl-diaminopimelate desuccinylase-like protein
MDVVAAAARSDALWEEDALPVLSEYIRIPCLSPDFAPGWEADGHVDRAAELLRAWAADRPLDGLTVEVVRLEGRTPVIVCEVPAAGAAGDGTHADDDTVLLYGHLDKQPEFTGWRDGLGPWEPVREGDRLYGRGAGDDGYAIFAALGAIEALRAGGGDHARCVVIIEASEESGSPDLPAYVEALADRLGRVSLVVCLDSGCETWDRLWVTTSLRGLLSVTVRVEVLEAGMHSGTGSGVVPSSFRILRQLLSRIEDETTGDIRLRPLHVDVPADRAVQIEEAAAELRPEDMLHGAQPVEGLTPVADGETATMLRNRTWRPTLSTIGIEGVPPVQEAGNVLRPFTTVKLSFRLPPTCDADEAAAAVEAALTEDPPYHARVTVDTTDRGAGWNAPSLEPWLAEAIDQGSKAAFGEPARYIGEGGSIPFMGMLGERYPEAQFLVTGVLGPESNAHGPNEFLHVPTAKAVTVNVACVLDAHARR